MSIQESTNEESKGGLLDSVKAMLLTVISMGQTRLELLSTELEEERERVTVLLVWTLITLFTAAMTTVLLTILIIVACWDSYRLLSIAIMLCVFIAGLAMSWRILTLAMQNKPRIFAATASELAKDCDELSQRDE